MATDCESPSVLDTAAATPLETSRQVDQVLPALFAVQGEIRPAVKGSQNTFHKSRYADLSEVWEACREPLRQHGFTVLYPLRTAPAGVTEIMLILWHSSGQWVRTGLPISPNADPQKIGSAITYFRRYLLASLLAIPTVDDDGEAAMDRETAQAGRRDERPRSSSRGPAHANGHSERQDVNQAFPSKQDIAKAKGELRRFATDFRAGANRWWKKYLAKQERQVPAEFQETVAHENHVLFHLTKDAAAKGAITLPPGFKYSADACVEALALLWIDHAQAMDEEAWRWVKQDRPRQIRKQLDKAEAYEEALAN